MAIVDPWGGFNQGLSTLNSAITGIQDRQRQGRLDDMAMQQNQRAMRLSDLQYSDMERKSQEDQYLRDTLANAHGSTQYVPQQGMSLASIGAPSQGLPSQPMPWESPAPQPTTGPQVGMDNRFTPPNPAAITAQVRMGQGRTEEAMKAISLDDALAQYGAKVQQGGGDIREFYAQKQKVEKLKQVGDFIAEAAKSPGGIRGAWPMLVSAFPELAKASPDDFKAEGNYITKDEVSPDGKLMGRVVYDPEKRTIHVIAPPKAPDSGAHNITEIPSQDGKSAQKFQYNPQTQRYDIPVGGAYAVKSQVPNVNIKVNASTEDQVEKDAQAIMKFQLAPSDLGKRNGHDAKVRAAILAQDPSFDFIQAQAKAVLAKNVKVQDKAGNAAILPDLIKDVADSGKKLNYSDFAPLGKGGQWWDKMTNNPDYINYAAKRNDIILRIGSVMRENGMTDQAQKLEEDSAPRSMSPRSFDAWAKAQMTVLSPIMNKYTSQAQGRGTPMKGRTSGAAPKTVGRFTIEVE